MDTHGKHERGEQKQNSRQSGKQGAHKSEGGRGAEKPGGTGIGSSQGQDRGSPGARQERPGRSNGTADVERGTEQGGTESLVDDMTGAFKERP